MLLTEKKQKLYKGKIKDFSNQLNLKTNGLKKYSTDSGTKKICKKNPAKGNKIE